MSIHRTLDDAEQAVKELDAVVAREFRTSRDERVRHACDVVTLVAKFVNRCFDEHSVVVEKIRDAVRSDGAYVDAFARIHDTANKFSACLGALEKRKTLATKLTELADDICAGLGDAVEAFIAVVNERQASYAISQEERTKALNLASEVKDQIGARQVIRDDDRAQAEQRSKASDAAVKLLEDVYEKYAERENDKANLLRSWAIGTLVVIAGFALTVNFRTDDLTVGVELLRLSVTVPLAVLAGYLGRESSRHRRFARWADARSIHLQSFRVFTDSLGEQGNELRRALGEKIFGSTADTPGTDAEPGMFDDLTSALAQGKELLDRRENRP
jgi:hypothetical protein